MHILRLRRHAYTCIYSMEFYLFVLLMQPRVSLLFCWRSQECLFCSVDAAKSVSFMYLFCWRSQECLFYLFVLLGVPVAIINCREWLVWPCPARAAPTDLSASDGRASKLTSVSGPRKPFLPFVKWCQLLLMP